eukprot:NODE_786_length_1869_cov_67.121699_g733_i0.p1 GENE.NODE_786_length_1869_cov_67.121699_g733_i0~~NODE_786_length_1869_cov_67.121699_g733_i0.p1  ORF type:complete len:562 (+),score=152.67 NODE_786_length_1869_cov_67.121699_g733_i0:98-1783(+)
MGSGMSNNDFISSFELRSATTPALKHAPVPESHGMEAKTWTHLSLPQRRQLQKPFRLLARNDPFAAARFQYLQEQAGGEDDGKTFRMPLVCMIVILAELCERFAFNGARGLLPMYFPTVFGWTQTRTTLVISFWTGFAYFTPLIGGFLADSTMGRFHVICSFCSIYILGLLTLAISNLPAHPYSSLPVLFALFLIAVGTGGIKPVVSTFGADQIADASPAVMQSYFLWFYWSINVGSILGQFVTPIIKETEGYFFAFLGPCVLMSLSTLLIYSAKHRFVHTPPAGSVLVVFFQTIRDALKAHPSGYLACITSPNPNKQVDGRHWLDWAVPQHPVSTVTDIKALFRIFPIFAAVPFFWLIYDSAPNLWIPQASSMDLSLFGWEIPPELACNYNAFFILILLPLFDSCVYPLLAQCCTVTLLGRMAAGMFVSGFAFAAAGLLQLHINHLPAHSVSILWQAPQWALLSCAEILVSVTGLEFAYSGAPACMKSAVAALWLLTVWVGDTFFGTFYPVLSSYLPTATKMAQQYFVLGGLSLVPFLIFVYLMLTYKDDDKEDPYEELE